MLNGAVQGEIADLSAEISALSSSGSFGEALAKVNAALEQHSNEPDLLFERASALFDWGRLREARDGYLQAEAAGMRRLALYVNLAWSHHLSGFPREAERHIRKALALDPDSIPSRFCLGTILRALTRYSEAIAAYEAVLAHAPEDLDCLANIAACHLDNGTNLDAEACARRAIAIAPDRPGNWANLAMSLGQQDRYMEALEAFKRAVEIEAATGENVESFVSHAYWLSWSGQPQAALDLCRRKLATQPNPVAHGQYAFALLTMGQYREGWEQYEFRLFLEPQLSKRRPSARPAWAGQDLSGKTLFLRAEQGAGDTIQFARFAASFKAMGATVILQVQPELRNLAKGFAAVDRVFSLGEPEPPFDYYLHMMSAAHALGIDLAGVPADIPYLRTNPIEVQRWAARISGSAVQVGLAWAGNRMHLRDRHRSISLDTLSALWDVKGVHYVSMQKELKQDESMQLSSAGVLNLGGELGDFGDTAAMIASLDLVICVDTAIAHLAGAMGKPVWLLLPEHADFRWLRDRADSPWYPTMRLFRQRRMGEWGEVITRVRAALEQWAMSGSMPPAESLVVQQPGQIFTASESATSHDIDEGSIASNWIARIAETRNGIVQYIPESDDVARSIAFYGEFLQPQQELLARLLRPGAVVLEAGSGIGIHALGLAKILGSDGHLILYEDRPLIRRILQQNLDANQAARGNTLMRHSLGGGTNAKASDESHQRPETEPDRETVDELLLDRLDLLKVFQADAADILDGASATIWRLRPLLFLTADAGSVSALASKTGELGYRCWQMETALFQASNFNCRNRDVFNGQSAFALLAIPEEREVDADFPGCVELTAQYA